MTNIKSISNIQLHQLKKEYLPLCPPPSLGGGRGWYENYELDYLLIADNVALVLMSFKTLAAVPPTTA